MDITVNTKLVPLLGKPLGQSLSSRMANRIYESVGLDYYRFPIEVEKEDLPAVLNGLRCMNVAAFGVTKPYKVEIMQYLDEIDPLARKIGAVNSVTIKNRRLIGRNLDGLAFVKSLAMAFPSLNPSETTFFCFGAGGAGRAICCTLADKGARRIILTDKFNASAEKTAGDINRDFAPIAETVSFEDKEQIRKMMRQADVVMNATGLGMYPHLTATPADKSWFLPEQIAFDATYNPSETQFLKDAKEAGCRTINGKGMIIGCGMMGFRDRAGWELPYETWSGVFDELLKEFAVPEK